MHAGRRVQGRVVVPGSKSITNRALVCAALAGGTSNVTGTPAGDDAEAMIAGLTTLGHRLERRDGTLTITPVGPAGGDRVIDAGASGTTMRFLIAVAALSTGPTVLDGTDRMRQRPVGPLVAALRALDVGVEYLGEAGFPPVVVRGPLRGRRTSVDATLSSQFVTALMLIGPCLPEGLTLDLVGAPASRPYLVTTAEVMEAFGATVHVGDTSIVVSPGGYRATTFAVEPDASAAVYAWVGAAMTAGTASVADLPGTSSQADMRVLGVLEKMGAVIDRGTEVTVHGPEGGLRGVDVDLASCPDGAVALAVAAATARGTSRFTGLGTLRLKETDRLAALEAELIKVGAMVTCGSDSIEVVPGPLHGATIATYDDHRMAMSFALLGLVVPGIRIADPGCVSKTWPGFWTALDEATAKLPVIAIDGPAGTGKTTVATAVAEALDGTRLDTGAFYRAATLLALRSGIDPEDGDAIAARLGEVTISYDQGSIDIDGVDVSSEIRSPAVNAAVSAVSAHPAVRSHLVNRQREWVTSARGVVVVEGRDIGTVVFPDAACKIYLDASPEVRAQRRALEDGTDPREELARLAGRDEVDSTRDASPLRPAVDAWILDTSTLTIDEVVEQVVARHRSLVR